LSRIGYAAAGLVLAVVVIAGAAGAGFASLLTGGDTTPSTAAAAGIPPAMLGLYTQAAATCPGLPWTVLAAIGTVESAQGRNAQTSSAGAVGIMQFEPATFAEYATPVPPGGADPPSPLDPTDAVYAAARDLCANGARNGADLPGAVWQYNHSGPGSRAIGGGPGSTRVQAWTTYRPPSCWAVSHS
jgi:soluble lytic murein transglycosylase-like protein